MAKIGVNAPCPCDSGKKYKKCCRDKDVGGVRHRVLPPEELALIRAKMEEIRRTAEREKFSGPPSLKLPVGPDHIVRFIWNRGYPRPKTETFHQFIINILRWTVGEKWQVAQAALPAEKQHAITRWFDALKELVSSPGLATFPPGHVHQLTLTGEVKELLALADDVYRLQLVRKLPRKLLERLRSHDRFQGARYEIAIAASFVRCGFEIEWLEEKSKKHCEFNARQKGTGEVIAVETKSRHRAGMLNQPGTAPQLDSIRADVRKLFREALQQNPEDKPFLIFIDLNMPHEPERSWHEKSWVSDIVSMVNEQPATPANPSSFTGLVTTNFAWHYEGRDVAAGTEALFILRNPVKYPIKDGRTFEALRMALSNYGIISNDE